ncbi:MAG: hypothetical protein Ta2B_11360 [Termitinemataceae bacterium]|nr:MAG: hypothetical protein Ta2B_11360 [Termitinemataceae bacterium]
MIFNAQGLKAIGDPANRNVNWFLANDIDLAEESGAWDGPDGYTGTFNGNGKTINGLKLTRTDSDTGLFDSLGEGATVENFTVKVSTPTPLSIAANVHFGGIIGIVNVGGNPTKFITLKNIRVEGTLKYSGLSTNSWLIVGGFLGEVKGGSKVNIEKCVSAINVEANLTNDNSAGNYDAAVGGFIGKLFGGTVNITDSYSTGNVLLNNSGNRNSAAGGFIGALGNSNMYGETGTIEIKNSYSAVIADVRVNGNRPAAVGGLVGGSQNVTVNLHNSVALNESINATGSGTIYTGRVIGMPTGVTLDDNYANSAMKINNAAVNDETDEDATKAKKHGEGKALSDMNKAFWTGLGFSEAIWDFTGLNVASGIYPKLK